MSQVAEVERHLLRVFGPLEEKYWSPLSWEHCDIFPVLVKYCGIDQPQVIYYPPLSLLLPPILCDLENGNL